uniref:Reverse transcriptase domain-containing protein n=1 Tax=Cannabis sativa TaxID=3483 RepID=A0A803QEK6_CANSA
MGDMNNVLSQEDKRGGNNYPDWLLRGFQQAVNDCELQDLELIGHPFTWEKGRGTDQWIEVRLDRALCTKNWLDLFPLAKLYNLELSTSDHCPIFLDLVDNILLVMKKKFRFENCWLREPLCHQVIKECWNFSSEFDIQEKIKYCGEFLLVWGEAYSGDFKKRLKECKAEINLWKHGRDSISTNNFRTAKSKFKEILTQREVFWRQRSKQLWLQAGDNNSKFFHASASARRRSNSITKLQDSNGIWTSWEDGLDRIMVEYFKDLFTTSGTASIDVNDIVRLVQDFFLTGSLPTGLNHTNIVLIPKKKQPTAMGDLRPISLCNVIYKVVSKVLANRLKVVLPIVISDTQSSFLSGRLISDNILVSFEIMHYLKRKTKGKHGFMALKLDMSKAYDRLEWGYLRAVLLRMGFDGRWVNLIMQCVSSVSYSIVHGCNALTLRDATCVLL